MKRVRRVSIGERMRVERQVEVRVIMSEVRGEVELRMSEFEREGSGMLRSVERRDVLKVSRVRRRIL
jgi:hypothetical protein